MKQKLKIDYLGRFPFLLTNLLEIFHFYQFLLLGWHLLIASACRYYNPVSQSFSGQFYSILFIPILLQNIWTRQFSLPPIHHQIPTRLGFKWLQGLKEIDIEVNMNLFRITLNWSYTMQIKYGILDIDLMILKVPHFPILVDAKF